MDWILPVVAHYDYWLQEKEARQTVGEVIWRRTSGWLAGSHHLGSYLPHLFCSATRHCLYVCQVIPSRRSDTAKPSHSHYCCVNWPHCVERGCLTCPLPYLPLPWANARLLLRAVWCSHGNHCPHTWYDRHDWILRVFRKHPSILLHNFV